MLSHGWRPAWVVGVALGLLACFSLLVIPVESVAWVVVARGTSLVALVVFALTNLRLPAGVRHIWWAVWVYLALTVAADIVFDVQQRVFEEEPFPGPADVLYLSAYAASLSALLMLVRRVHPGRDREAWIDTMIVTIAATAIVGILVLGPTVRDRPAPTWQPRSRSLYPLLDIVMLSGLVRLLLGWRTANPALMMLVGWVRRDADRRPGLQRPHQQRPRHPLPAWLDALFLLSLVVLTASASAPGADAIDTPATRESSASSSGRVSGLTMGVLTIPVILLTVGYTEDNAAVALLSAAAILVIFLVLWRVRRLLAMVDAQSQQLATQARTDGLTGIANRRTLDYELERLDANPATTSAPLTVAMLDLDHFKEFNDEFGHRVGDDMLVQSARAWRQALDGTGFLARYGGEEFTILLPGFTVGEVRDLLEAVRRPRRTGRPSPSAPPSGWTPNGVRGLDRADQALYRAKESGRDRLVIA